MNYSAAISLIARTLWLAACGVFRDEAGSSHCVKSATGPSPMKKSALSTS